MRYKYPTSLLHAKARRLVVLFVPPPSCTSFRLKQRPVAVDIAAVGATAVCTAAVVTAELRSRVRLRLGALGLDRTDLWRQWFIGPPM